MIFPENMGLVEGYELYALGKRIVTHYREVAIGLEKEMAIYSNIFACKIPGMGEPGGLPSMGSHRVGHD